MKNREEELKMKVLAKCWNDPAFRERFKNDPRGVMQKEFDYTFPDDLKVEVIETDNKTLLLQLPDPPVKSGELSEEELSKLAAGVGTQKYIWDK